MGVLVACAFRVACETAAKTGMIMGTFPDDDVRQPSGILNSHTHPFTTVQSLEKSPPKLKSTTKKSFETVSSRSVTLPLKWVSITRLVMFSWRLNNNRLILLRGWITGIWRTMVLEIRESCESKSFPFTGRKRGFQYTNQVSLLEMAILSLPRFGYATDETPELMPKTIMLAHQLNAAMAAARRDGSMGWLRPDSKTQVTIEYKKDTDGAVIPLRVDTIVISTQHAEEITTEDLRKQIKEGIIKKVISADLLDERTVYHVGGHKDL